MKWIYEEALEALAGWCVPCDAWTVRDVEPEAVAMVCPRCDHRGVVGVDVALAHDLIYSDDGLVGSC